MTMELYKKYLLNESMFDDDITDSEPKERSVVPIFSSSDPETVEFFMHWLKPRKMTGGYWDIASLMLAKTYQYYYGSDGKQDPASVPLLDKVYLNMLIGEARPDRRTGGGTNMKGQTNTSLITNFTLLQLFDTSVRGFVKPGPLLKQFCEGEIEVEGEVNESGRKYIKIYVDNPKLSDEKGNPMTIKHDFRPDFAPGKRAYGWVDRDGTNAKGCSIRRTCTSATNERADKEFFEQFGDWIQKSGRHYRLFPGEQPQEKPEDDPYVTLDDDAEDDTYITPDDDNFDDAGPEDVVIPEDSPDNVNMTGANAEAGAKETPTNTNKKSSIYSTPDDEEDGGPPEDIVLDESITTEAISPDTLNQFTQAYRAAMMLDDDCDVAEYYSPFNVNLVCCVQGLPVSRIRKQVFGK